MQQSDPYRKLRRESRLGGQGGEGRAIGQGSVVPDRVLGSLYRGIPRPTSRLFHFGISSSPWLAGM